MKTTFRPFRRASMLALAACALGTAVPAGATAIDLGDPSVMSQRGQRLKLAVPYGSTPGERVSIGRFEVVSVRAPEGFAAPGPGTFSIAKPERRNLVILHSSEPVDAPELELALRVAGQPGSEQTWRIAVPPARLAAAPAADAAPARASAAERAARRVPTRPAPAVR